MRYTTHLYNTKSTSVLIPFFTAETGEKREAENVKRMNGFYDELKRSVAVFCESDTFPDGGRYFAKSTVSEDGDRLTVKVVMRLRVCGECISGREMTHIWKDGVIVSKKIEG